MKIIFNHGVHHDIDSAVSSGSDNFPVIRFIELREKLIDRNTSVGPDRYDDHALRLKPLYDHIQIALKHTASGIWIVNEKDFISDNIVYFSVFCYCTHVIILRTPPIR